MGPPLTILFPAPVSPCPSLALSASGSLLCVSARLSLFLSSSLSLSVSVHLSLGLGLGPPNPQQSLKAESRPLEGSPAQLPILADMLLYYCRFAARPVLLQVYQTEVRPALPPGPTSSPRLAAGLLPHPGSQQPCAGAACAGGPSWRSTLTPTLLPSPADLHHRGEDDRDLHPLPGAGSLCCHTRHQGFGWAEPQWRRSWGLTQRRGRPGEEGSQGSGAGGTRSGQGGRAQGL